LAEPRASSLARGSDERRYPHRGGQAGVSAGPSPTGYPASEASGIPPPGNARGWNPAASARITSESSPDWSAHIRCRSTCVRGRHRSGARRH